MKKAKTFLAAWTAALEQLSTQALAPLTVIAGGEPAVKERLIEAVMTRARGSIEVINAQPGENEANAARRLLDTWSTPVLFGGRQLLVARGAEKLISGARAAGLVKLLEGEEPPHRLLITVDTLDGRTKLAKQLRSSGGLINLPPLRDAPPPWHEGGPFLKTDLNEWLMAESQLQGLRCDLVTANELSQRVGNEPGRLIQTLAMLARLLPEGTALDRAFVATHVRHTSVRLLGLWEDAVVEGRAGAAAELSDRMQREGMHDPFGRLVIGALAGEVVLRTFLTRLARVIEAQEQLGDAALAALASKPWDRPAAAVARLDEVLGKSGGRVFLERDLRRMDAQAAPLAFDVALDALRRLRDGKGGSLPSATVRLAQSFAAPRPRSRAS